MSGVEHHQWSGLTQDNIETLSEFRMEVNIHRARTGQEAIEVNEALKYLKATGFSSAKANEVIKNYMKHRENYQLDNLNPHRSPLSSEIGSKKLEIIGTQDSEGSPVVLFTGSRHDMKASEHKFAMQLLFYTLDQLVESEDAADNGVVFIMDMRECSLSSFDIRYINSFLSVLKDGYPLLIKRVYVVSAPFWMKGQVTVLKAWKQDSHKIKLLAFSDLSKHFSESQLPLSLGGTFVPNSVQQQQSRHVGHASGPKISHLPKQSPSVPVKQSHSHSTQSHSHDLSSSSSHGSAVNDLVSMFGGSGKTGFSSPQTSSSHLHQSPPPAHKPTPPSHKHKPPNQQHQVKGQSKPVKLSSSTNSASKVRPMPPPKVNSHTPATNGEHSSSDNKGAFKVPMLPPSVMKSSSPAKTTAVSSSSKAVKATTPPDMNPQAGGRGILARIKNFEYKQQTTDDSSQPKKSKPPLKKTASDDWTVEGKPTDFSASWTSGVSERQRSGSAGNSPKLKPKDSPTRNRKARVPIKLRSPDSQEKKDQVVKEKVRQPMLPRSFQPQVSREKDKPSAYENMEVPVSMTTTTTPPHAGPPSLASFYNDDIYENVQVDRGPPPPVPSSTSRSHSSHPTESTAYENVTIQKAPPKPPAAHHASHAVSSSLRDDYENITILEEDDETYFGKEGPPGMQEVIYENFGPDEGYRSMSVHELEEHIKSKGKKGLSAEYYRIRNEPLTGLYETCRLPCNTSKNRYKDVVCYDASRVALNRLPGVDGSDYIHANYVNGYKRQHSFILTQGPKDKTVADFWRLVWEKQVTVIVMITKCVELGKRKCSQYWPDSGSTAIHGKVTVTVSDTEDHEGYDIRKMIISCQGVERTVMHYQFLAWPDYGVPKNGSHVLHLLQSVCEVRSSSRHSPVIVHCSAGVGRSGAFVALDNSIDELQDLKKVNLQAIVRRIRLQRAYCIQTDEQYEFCYRTLLEYAKSVLR